jgi:hypothetical protein
MGETRLASDQKATLVIGFRRELCHSDKAFLTKAPLFDQPKSEYQFFKLSS